MNKKTLYKGEAQITQFGTREGLAPIMFEDKKAPVKVYFYPETGAIKQIIQKSSNKLILCLKDSLKVYMR